MALKILYADAQIIAVHKPAGFLVYGDRSTLGTPDCKRELERKFKKTVWPVHRLDKETSGVLLFARSSVIAHALTETFRDRRTEKRYQALVWGELTERIEINTPLKKNKSTVMESAVTHVFPLETFASRGEQIFSLIECVPQTGRYHQIRRHLSSIRHGIVGDTIYGPKKFKPFEKMITHDELHLCAIQIKFKHPQTSKIITVQTEADGALEKSIQVLSRGKNP